MNLLPAVEAYIAERQKQLREATNQPFQTIRELECVAILCAGLRQQSDAMDAMLAPELAKPQAGVWPCPQCLGRILHHPTCPQHPRNLTKL